MSSDISKIIRQLPSTGRLFIQGAAATPQILIKSLVENADHFKNLEIMHLHTIGPAPYADPKYKDNFRVTNFFVGANMRPYLDFDRVDYLPCFLSEIPRLLRTGPKKPNVAFVHVSTPDNHGFVTLGTSVDVTRAAVDGADIVVAQVNPQMPRIQGDGVLHKSEIDYFVECNEPLPASPLPPLSKEEDQIGRHIASLIEDGSTLQMGIGAIPNAVLKHLTSHKNLGMHTEMWSDGALDLMKSGVINNSKKKIHPHRNVSSFLFGTEKLYEFVNDNPSVVQLDVAYVNNPRVIARNPRVVAINSAVEVDLTGQVCADSIGHNIISGVGGQLDFIRGATLSDGGKAIITLPSRTKKGLSRIVATLKEGAGVVTTRAHVHYVVTEYGIADLYGKTLNQRANALIEVSHPADREMLAKDWWKACH